MPSNLKSATENKTGVISVYSLKVLIRSLGFRVTKAEVLQDVAKQMNTLKKSKEMKRRFFKRNPANKLSGDHIDDNCDDHDGVDFSMFCGIMSVKVRLFLDGFTMKHLLVYIQCDERYGYH